jgi:hypothetical protein
MKWRQPSTRPLLTHQRLSSALKRIDSMRWTAHLQECLHEIEARREASLDDALVQCVKIQLIADKAINSASLDVNIELDPYFRPPPNLFTQELLAQLGRLRSSMGTATWQEGELIPFALRRLVWCSAHDNSCQCSTSDHRHSYGQATFARRRNFHYRSCAVWRPYRCSTL